MSTQHTPSSPLLLCVCGFILQPKHSFRIFSGSLSQHHSLCCTEGCCPSAQLSAHCKPHPFPPSTGPTNSCSRAGRELFTHFRSRVKTKQGRVHPCHAKPAPDNVLL
uniref:Secreted protein n=1 Tax=Denticeps clupeoides TaxID=299321 RepID=A0AAY4A3Z8_9TELE